MVFWSCPFIYFKWILVIGKTGNIYKQKIKNKKTNQTLLSSLCSSSMLLSLLLLISSHFSSKPTTRNPTAAKQNPMDDPWKKKQSYSILSPAKLTTMSTRT